MEKRSTTDGRVGITGCVIRECIGSGGRVVGAGCIAKKRNKAHRRIVVADCVVNERIIANERVVVAKIAALLANRSRCRQERKTGQSERCKQ